MNFTFDLSRALVLGTNKALSITDSTDSPAVVDPFNAAATAACTIHVLSNGGAPRIDRIKLARLRDLTDPQVSGMQAAAEAPPRPGGSHWGIPCGTMSITGAQVMGSSRRRSDLWFGMRDSWVSAGEFRLLCAP